MSPTTRSPTTRTLNAHLGLEIHAAEHFDAEVRLELERAAARVNEVEAIDTVDEV